MGTSQTCKGPSNKSPLEPEWLDTDFKSSDNNDGDTHSSDTKDVLIVPNDSVGYKDRFRVARIALSKYLRTGDNSQLKKSFASYIQNSGGAGIVADHHYVAIELGSRFLSLLAYDYQTIKLALVEGKKPEDILSQIVKQLDLRRGTLEIENLLKILNDVMGSNIIIDVIEKEEEYFPWKDILLDFICEWIFSDYAQNMNYFEKGTLNEQIEKEHDIKDFLQVDIKLRLEGIDFENLSMQQIKKIIHDSFYEVYSDLEKENFDE